jgi:hypothetical protein
MTSILRRELGLLAGALPVTTQSTGWKPVFHDSRTAVFRHGGESAD